MSGEMKETLTPREARLCRDAYQQGAADRSHINIPGGSADPLVMPQDSFGPSCASLVATTRYPMPTVEVPRVVQGLAHEFRIVNDRLEWRNPNGPEWYVALGGGASDRLRFMLDNPTMRVPADEAEGDVFSSNPPRAGRAQGGGG